MNRERANDIVAALVGSAGSIEACLNEGESADDAVLIEAIDDSIFNCVVCGWWCELEEMADADEGPQCNDCHEGE